MTYKISDYKISCYCTFYYYPLLRKQLRPNTYNVDAQDVFLERKGKFLNLTVIKPSVNTIHRLAIFLLRCLYIYEFPVVFLSVCWPETTINYTICALSSSWPFTRLFVESAGLRLKRK